MKSAGFKAIWSEPWNNNVFKTRLITGLLLFIVLVSLFPVFFQWIEKRQGFLWRDPLLSIIPAINLSIPIFLIIYGVTIFILMQCSRDPKLLLQYLWGFNAMSVLRIITLTATTLNAPEGLIPIRDPVSLIFYGHSFITKDLFFSGHTATQFLIYFNIKHKKGSWMILVCSILIGIMVLLQHVHYTADVIVAPLAAWLAYKGGKYIANAKIRDKSI